MLARGNEMRAGALPRPFLDGRTSPFKRLRTAAHGIRIVVHGPSLPRDGPRVHDAAGSIILFFGSLAVLRVTVLVRRRRPLNAAMGEDHDRATQPL